MKHEKVNLRSQPSTFNSTMKYTAKSSCECNKIVSDILGKIELSADLENAG